jgi:ElaB/YqjD/DUF883 family membrane-anchored ribosome-binding protein
MNAAEEQQPSTEQLKKWRQAAKGRMKRAQRIKSQIMNELGKINAELSKASQDYHNLDREIAERNITYLPSPEENKKNKGSKKSVDQQLAELSSEQIAELKAQLEKMIKEGGGDND